MFARACAWPTVLVLSKITNDALIVKYSGILLIPNIHKPVAKQASQSFMFLLNSRKMLQNPFTASQTFV
jgi:hypothetical protein